MEQSYLPNKAAQSGAASSPQAVSQLLIPPRLIKWLWLLVGLLGTVLSATAQFCPNSTTVAGGDGPGSAANQLDRPRGVYVDTQGNVYVADNFNNRIQRWSPGATEGTTVAGGNGPGSAANQLNSPNGVYVDAQGNVYVADTDNNRIQRWSPELSFRGITVAGPFISGLSSLNNQLSVYVDAGGYLYVGDTYNNVVQRFSPSPVIVQQPPASLSLCQGTPVSVSVSVSGPVSSYQWYQDNTPLADQTLATLSLATTSPANSGRYVVVVTGNCNVTSRDFNLTVYATPTAFAVTGGGAYCTGGSGVSIGLSGSQTGVAYQLYRDASAVDNPVAGTGTALSFGPQTQAGTYTVQATTTTSSCQQTMTGSVNVSMSQTPTASLTNNGPISCASPTVSLSATGGGSYRFSPGATQVGGVTPLR